MTENLGKNMMIYSGSWQGAATFRLMPTSLDCPYAEGLFDPSNKVLVIITKVKANKLHMVDKLDNDGAPQISKKTGKTCQKQIQFETPLEHYLQDKGEILNFLDLFVINADDHDIEKFFETGEKEKKVITEK